MQAFPDRKYVSVAWSSPVRSNYPKKDHLLLAFSDKEIEYFLLISLYS
jgi:hypothetical protein